MGWGQAKEPASQCTRVCQNCPLANYPLVSHRRNEEMIPVSAPIRGCLVWIQPNPFLSAEMVSLHDAPQCGKRICGLCALLFQSKSGKTPGIGCKRRGSYSAKGRVSAF